jgi:hypothetical protein
VAQLVRDGWLSWQGWVAQLVGMGGSVGLGMGGSVGLGMGGSVG